MKKLLCAVMAAVFCLLASVQIFAATPSASDANLTSAVATVTYTDASGVKKTLGTYDTLDAAFEAVGALYAEVLTAGINDGEDADENNSAELYAAAGSPVIKLNGNFSGNYSAPSWATDTYDAGNVPTIVIDGAKSDTENYQISCGAVTLFDRLAFYNLVVRNTNMVFTRGASEADNNIRWNGNIDNCGTSSERPNAPRIPGESFTVFENCTIDQISTLSAASGSGGLFKMNGYKKANTSGDSVTSDKYNLTLKDCVINTDTALGLQVHWGADANIILENTQWTLDGNAGCGSNNDPILKSYEAGDIYIRIDGRSKLISRRTEGTQTVALIRNLNTMAGTCHYELEEGAELILDNYSSKLTEQSFIGAASPKTVITDHGAKFTVSQRSVTKTGFVLPVTNSDTESTAGYIDENGVYYDAGKLCSTAGTFRNALRITEGFGMIDGAAIRTVEGQWGIRFSAHMTDEFLASLGDEPSFGMVFGYGSSGVFDPYASTPAVTIKCTKLEKGFMGYDNVFHGAIFFDADEYDEKSAYLCSVQARAFFEMSRDDGTKTKIYSSFDSDNVRSIYSVAEKLKAKDPKYADHPVIKKVIDVATMQDANEFITSLYPDATVLGSSPTCKEIILEKMNITSVLNTFINAGFSKISTNGIVGAKFDTYMLSRNGDLVTMYFFPESGELRIMWESRNDNAISVLTPNETTGTGSIVVAQVGTDRVTEKDNPLNGMCYVIKLSNGRAIIIDGGFFNDVCAGNIYKTLEKMDIAKDEEGRFIVEAWIFSHPHGDHVGAIQNYAKLYAGKTVVNYMVHNLPGDGKASTNETNLVNKLNACFPGAKRVNPHAGLKYYFGNVTIDMLYTPELLYSYKGALGYSNDTSIVYKLSGGGASLLSYGDSGNEASRVMWNAYESTTFKVDILQINHHGLYTSANNGHVWDYVKKVYEATGATYAFLPAHSKYGPDSRNGRFTVMIQWCNSGYQISYVMNESDNHGLSSISQNYYNSFVESVKNGTNTHETLYGYNGINKIVSEEGLITYTGGNNDVPMITMFTFADGNATLTVNEELYKWLAEE